MQKSLYSGQNDVFLELLRNHRELLCLRQRDLAKLLGRGQATVSKVEAGMRRLDIIELRTWLNALEVDFVSFVEELEQRLRDHAATDAQTRMTRTSIALSRRRRTACASGRQLLRP